MKRLISCVVVALVSTAAMAAPTIQHAPLSCVPAADSTKVVATIADATSAKVFFKTTDGATEYWTEMSRSGDQFWAVLPRVCGRQKAVSYRIEARGADGAVSATPAIEAPVNGCAAPELSAEEAAAAANMVVGVSTEEERDLKGFRCQGVVSRLTPSGKLERFEDCNDCFVAGVPPAVGLTAAGLITAGTLGIVIDELLDDDKSPDVVPVSPVVP
jgi:hypothetical protein